MYCNTFRSIKAAFLELEKTMFTIATLVPMVTIITPGPLTRSEQSMTFKDSENRESKSEEK